MGLESGWRGQALPEQVNMLQAACSCLAENNVPRGSWLRAAAFRECARVAKSMVSSESSLQASLQQADNDPGVALIATMKNAMAIAST